MHQPLGRYFPTCKNYWAEKPRLVGFFCEKYWWEISGNVVACVSHKTAAVCANENFCMVGLAK